MPINVYIVFDGNCREAVELYGKVFDSEPRMMTFSEAPPNPDFTIPDEAKDLVMHAELSIEGSSVMFSDNFPGSPYVNGNNILLTIVSNDIDRVKSIFNQLKEGGQVEMELQETHWSKCYGKLTDRFGVEWQISHDSESDKYK